MTAHGNEAIANKALRLGAASYVPKAQQNERLLATVAQVLARAAVEKNRQQPFASAHSFDCTFAIDGDPALVRPLVDFAQQVLCGVSLTDAAGRIRISIAFEEGVAKRNLPWRA